MNRADGMKNLALWMGLLTGPIIWFCSLEAKFALAPWVCSLHWKPAVYLVSLAAFVTTAGAGFIAWRQWLEADGERPRKMACAGVLLSAGFIVVLLAQSIPELMMTGCE